MPIPEKRPNTVGPAAPGTSARGRDALQSSRPPSRAPRAPSPVQQGSGRVALGEFAEGSASRQLLGGPTAPSIPSRPSTRPGTAPMMLVMTPGGAGPPNAKLTKAASEWRLKRADMRHTDPSRGHIRMPVTVDHNPLSGQLEIRPE